MRLPIYRHLNHRIEVFGLSLLELGLVCLLFLLASSLLHQVRFGSAITLAICFAAGALLRFFHRRFEAHYLEKFVRFVGLPDGLHRRLIRSMKSSKARAS